MAESKALGHGDESGFQFAQEMLAGDVTAAVNFDRLQRHPEKGFIMMEYLLCEEAQGEQHHVTPYTSHPNRYWEKNKRKFLSLRRAALDMGATLYLVNYAKKGTRYEDQVLLIEVLGMNEYGITRERREEMTRSGFQNWFRKLNRECLGPEKTILAKRAVYTRGGYYHCKLDCKFMRGARDYSTFDITDEAYYKGLRPCRECYRQFT